MPACMSFSKLCGLHVLCVRVGHLGVWGELVNHKSSLTHHPSSQGWAPRCPICFVFVCVWCVGSGFPSSLPQRLP